MSDAAVNQPRHAQRSIFRLLVIAMVTLLVGGFLALGSGSSAYGADPDFPDCNYIEGTTLIECYSDCYILICPSGFAPPIMVDLPGTAGDLIAVPADLVLSGGFPSVYTVVDNRVAGVGTVIVTNRTTFSVDADPWIVQLSWPLAFTGDPLPFVDECGVVNDSFTVPEDYDWMSSTEEFAADPPSSVSLAYTVQDDRVDGAGLVTVTVNATTSVGGEEELTEQSWEFAFTNEACGATTTPPGLAATGSDIGVAPSAALVLLVGGILILALKQNRRARHESR